MLSSGALRASVSPAVERRGGMGERGRGVGWGGDTGVVPSSSLHSGAT